MDASSDMLEGEDVERHQQEQGYAEPRVDQIGHGHLLLRTVGS
jgi:hypothetical protein